MATTLRPTDEIFELDLPQRAYNALCRNEVRTVGALARLSEIEFLRMRGVGSTTLKQVKERLAEHGLSMPAEPPDAAESADAVWARWLREKHDRPTEAEWIGRQLDALVEDSRVYQRSTLGTKWEGDGHEIKNRRRAWAWYRWGIDPDAEWPRDESGGFGYMAAPLPGSMELHLEGLNRLAHEELAE